MSVWRHAIVNVICGAACVVAASPACAQGVPGGRFEASVGAIWTGGASLGAAAATETAPAGRYTLFSTSSELSAAAGVEARIGVRMTPRLTVEASSSYSRPTLRTTISGDVENAAPVTATDALRQLTVDGALVLNLKREAPGRRAMPFIVGGAGYLRQLHEGDTLVVEGQRYFAGGGVRWLLMSHPRGLKGFGVRADVRALVQRRGAAFDGRAHTSPTLAAAVFARF